MSQPCPVHGCEYQEGYSVRMSHFAHGIVPYGPVRKRFPHANVITVISCSSRTSGRRKKVSYCPGCRADLARWCVEQRGREGDSFFVRTVLNHLAREGTSIPELDSVDLATDQS